jgi:hypothetical protein
MGVGSRTPPGELIYLSERKLFHLARLRGVSSAWAEREARRQTQGGPAGGGGSDHGAGGGGGERSSRTWFARRRLDPQRRARNIDEMLTRVVWGVAERDGLAALDDGALGIAKGGWFHFRRPLRVGVGAADDTRPSRALVLVDREPVELDGVLPSLLMHGSPRHLRALWPGEDLVEQAGRRGGPGTGTLFRRAAAVEMARETEIEGHLPTLVDRLHEGRHERGSSEELASMYETFASDDWVGALPLPQLADAAFCEGIALTSLITAGSGRTIVMASPLYVRIGPAGAELGEIESMLRHGRGIRGLLRRLRK